MGVSSAFFGVPCDRPRATTRDSQLQKLSFPDECVPKLRSPLGVFLSSKFRLIRGIIGALV